MANELPSANVESRSASAGGLVSGLDAIAVLGCSSAGLELTPRFYQGAKGFLAAAGYGDASECVCHYFKPGNVGKRILWTRLPTDTDGAIPFVNNDLVTGTCVLSYSGTPHRRYDFVVLVVTGGTIGVAGITFKISINGGRNYSGVIRLGTASTYVIPLTGVTINFAAGTLIAGDMGTARSTSPQPNISDIAAGIDAVIAQPQKFRAVYIFGDFSASMANTLKGYIDTYFAAHKRSIFLVNARDWYPDAIMTGEPSDVDFAAADTITRNTGDWTNDGFRVGMTVSITGTASNNFELEAVTVTSTVLTLADGLALEANVDGANIAIVGEETEEAWAASLLADFEGTLEDEKGRLGVGAGMMRITSQIHQIEYRAPVAWCMLERWMQHDIHVSPDRKADGPLNDAVLHDQDGQVVEHDARTYSALLAARFITARTYIDDTAGYIALASTFAPDGSAFGVLPWRAVANVYEEVVQKATEEFIGDHPELTDSNTLEQIDAERYKEFVESQLEAELRSAKTEGPRCSEVTWEPSTEDVLNVPNAILNGSGTLRTLGKIGTINTIVEVNPAAAVAT